MSIRIKYFRKFFLFVAQTHKEDAYAVFFAERVGKLFWVSEGHITSVSSYPVAKISNSLERVSRKCVKSPHGPLRQPAWR